MKKWKYVDEMRRIGEYREGRNRPILVKLVKESTTAEILRNTRKLKGTRVWIDEDYPKNIQAERAKLVRAGLSNIQL